LVGIIVATDSTQANSGWTYAVPVSHVSRILRVHSGNVDAKRDRNDIVVIQWRRPVVGMEIGGELDEVVVKRVSKGGPADRAGIKVGDRIVAVDGLRVRSPYQAVNPTLFKQPGDTAEFLVEQEDGTRSIKVVLGGGVAIPRAGGPQISQLIEPKIVIDGLVLRNSGQAGKATAAEVFGSEEALKAMDPDERKLLETAVERYQTVIEIQQRRLIRQEQQLKATEAENAALKKQLEEKSIKQD
jgi:membrane-associated protease RseP (regulator of RpoE activity)